MTLKASIRSLFLRFNTLIINSIDIIRAYSNTQTILRVIKRVIATLIKKKLKSNTRRESIRSNTY